MNRLAAAFACSVLLALQGCTYYGVPPPGTVPANYDRSFDAATEAMRDQGLAITVQDRTNGTVVGNNPGGTAVRAIVARQPDGSVRVQFDASDARDPSLLDRVSRSYDRRMGR